MQIDQAARLGRIEARAKVVTHSTPVAANGTSRWQSIGLILLAGVALIWFLISYPADRYGTGFPNLCEPAPVGEVGSHNFTRTD